MFVLDKINAIISRLLSARIIHNVMIDSYHREFERYGEFAIEHVEDIFCVDSYAILNLIDITMNTCSDIEKFKLQSSIALIEEYFKVFNISLDDKMLILHGISDSMYKEFGFNEYNRKSLNTLYRQYKPLVFSTYENHEDEQITLINNEIKKHHVKYKLSAEKIMNASKGSPLFIQKSLPSYIHMTMNRLWADKNRMYELVIYDFLVRYYKSYIAREKNKRK
jgi:thiopeptide-type bacteriocin biosynthesis domain